MSVQTQGPPLTAILPFCCNVVVLDGRLRYDLALPWFGPLVRPFIRHRAHRLERRYADGDWGAARAAWWGPPTALDQQALNVLTTACLLSMLVGFGGSLLTQTNAYAAKVYGVADGTLGVGLAIARVGVAGALVLSLTADRYGRRPFIVRAAIAHALITALTGVAPTFGLFITGHTLLRCVDTALGIALAVLVAETIPATCRAYAVAMVGVIGGFGIFVASMLLPVAAAGRPGLAAVHLLQLAALPLILRSRHLLNESPRYLAHIAERVRPLELLSVQYRRRLAKAGGALFLGLMFLGPATELMNRYLDDQRHFSASRIVLFLLLSSLPFLPMTMIGARQADLRGRKPIVIIGVSGATLAYAGMFLVGEPWIWPLGPIAAVFAAPGYAAISVYATELFPTRMRNTAGTMVNLLGVAGAATGLVVTGLLANHIATGAAIACLAVFPLLAVAVVAVTFPETARAELERTSSEGPAWSASSPVSR